MAFLCVINSSNILCLIYTIHLIHLHVHACQDKQICCYVWFTRLASNLSFVPCLILLVVCSVAEAGSQSTSCDVAEELSRQLEDILSTYCQADGSEDPAVPNGQPDGAEVNGLADRGDNKSEHASVNGNSAAEKDQRKLQEKKKVKGLGERIFIRLHICHFFFFFPCMTVDPAGI